MNKNRWMSLLMQTTLACIAPPIHAGPLASTDATQPSVAFDIRAAPHAADWRYFLRSAEKDREKLWTAHASQGAKLGDWAWGWRLGWVRSCDTTDRPFCRDIIRAALSDRAMVVRAEAATRLGRRFEGTGDPEILDLLAKTFQESRNTRHGRPLYIQNRILFAIHRIGGDEATKIGLKLSSAQPESRAYWSSLKNSQR
jgi:hypothetical protein